MADIIDITTRLKEYVLHFKCPSVVTLKGSVDIHFELSDSEGTAWVKAKSKDEAKQKVHKAISVTEWINDS